MTPIKRDSCASGIDADKIMREMLGKYLAVDSYLALLKDVVMNGKINTPDFRTRFNGVCQVRNNSKWRKVYYSLFAELVERRESVTLRDILPELDRRLKRKLGKDRLELSFSSKMLAYLRPSDFPIWDKWVIKNAAKHGLDLRLAEKGGIREREEEALRKFDELTQWAKKQLRTRKMKDALRRFDARLPMGKVKCIPAMKKLDWLLWADREE